MNDFKVDLHIHTTASDGTWRPQTLVGELLDADIRLFAVTDHDSVDSIPEVAALAKDHGLAFIPGVEINTTYNGRNYHLLGLGIDYKNTQLQTLIKRNRELAEEIDAASIKYLKSVIPDVSLSEYERYVNNPERGGWKSLNFLIDKKLCSNSKDYFPLFEGWGNPFRKAVFATPGEAIRVINMAGGVPILAHPGVDFYDSDYKSVISFMISEGIKGIECYHPKNGPEITRYCLDVCKSKDLLVTGGSDCHGQFVPERCLGRPDIRLSQLRIDGIRQYPNASESTGGVDLPGPHRNGAGGDSCPS